jgi:hypothetical protein
MRSIVMKTLFVTGDEDAADETRRGELLVHGDRHRGVLEIPNALRS